MASTDLTSLAPYTPPTYNTPPPPPPKPSQSTHPSTTAPPPPPRPSSPQTLPLPLPPPSPWLPPSLISKPTPPLHHLLTQPPLLAALSLTHPLLHPSPLPPHLHQTFQLATHLENQHAALLLLRQKTQSHLLKLHALERQWREKQARMDKELEAWSAKRLYQRLREAEREGEEVGRGVEGSWVEGGGEVGEREVVEFLRGWREGRGRVWRRREALERWDEGRVGGWR